MSRDPEQAATAGNERPASSDAARGAGFQLFLSHASEDASAVRELARQLRAAGIQVWLDLDELKPGDNWMECLEAGLASSQAFAVYIGQTGVARWINREVRVALDRNVKDPEFRVIPILGRGADESRLPAFLRQHQWLDLRDGVFEPARIKSLVGAVLSEPAAKVSLLAKGEAPFIGLTTYDVGQAHLFFGRDEETEEVVERLKSSAFLAVTGNSGSGKSSLLRAGVIPALHRGRFFDDQHQTPTWQVAIMRPGRDPFRELVNTLLDLFPDLAPSERLRTREECVKQLAEGTDGLCNLIGALIPVGHRTLLLVDQFEELFTQVADDDERDRFIDTLLEASDCGGDRPLHTVITMRTDFFSDCYAHRRLYEQLTVNEYPVWAMSRDRLAEVIEHPVEMAGAALESGLVEAILSDLGDGPGNLALLQHTLLQLWKKRSSDLLTHDLYQSIGRVQGALEHHAEEVFGEFSDDERELARKLLLALVMPGKGDKPTRRRAPVEEAIPQSTPAAQRVLDVLVEQRLLQVQQWEAAEDDVDEVEVTHEALLQGWGRLHGWLDEDKDFVRWRLRTTAAFEVWRESDEDPEALLGGQQLAIARDWLARRGADLTASGRDFIEKSIAKENRKARLKRAIVGTIAVLALLATLAALFANRARRQAEANLQLAESAVNEMLTRVGSEELKDVPQLEEVRRRLLNEARALYEQLGEKQPHTPRGRLQNALAPARVAEIDRQTGDAAKAREGLEEAIARLESLGGADAKNQEVRLGLSRIHDDMGRVLDMAAGTTEEYARAAEHYGRAIAMQEALHLERPNDDRYRLELGRSHLNRGILRTKMSLPEEAESDLLRALEVVAPVAETESQWQAAARQHLARTNNTLANFLDRIGRDDEATGRYRRALDGFTALNKAHPESLEYREEMAKTYISLADHLRSRDPQQALRHGEEALRLFGELDDPLTRYANDLANARNTVGVVRRRMGDAASGEEAASHYAAAAALFEQAALTYEALLDEARRHDRPPSPEHLFRWALALTNFGDSLLGAGGQCKRVGRIELQLEGVLPRLTDEQRNRIEGHSRYKRIQQASC